VFVFNFLVLSNFEFLQFEIMDFSLSSHSSLSSPSSPSDASAKRKTTDDAANDSIENQKPIKRVKFDVPEEPTAQPDSAPAPEPEPEPSEASEDEAVALMCVSCKSRGFDNQAVYACVRCCDDQHKNPDYVGLGVYCDHCTASDSELWRPTSSKEHDQKRIDLADEHDLDLGLCRFHEEEYSKFCRLCLEAEEGENPGNNRCFGDCGEHVCDKHFNKKKQTCHDCICSQEEDSDTE
jgi:hypothetical protein